MTTTKRNVELSFQPSPNWYCSSIASCDSTGLLAFGARSGISLVNIRNQRTITSLHGHSARVTGIDFLIDSSHLVSCSADKTVALWNYKLSKVEKQHKEHKVHKTRTIFGTQN